MIRVKFVNEPNYHSVAFTKVSAHVITLKGDNALVNMANTSGFTTYKEYSDALLGDFTDYTTVYRVTDTFIQYSNDGSVWEEPVEPTQDVVVTVCWNDAENLDEIRPDSVQLIVGGSTTVVVTAEDGWSSTLTGLPISVDSTITSVQEIEEYTYTLDGHAVTYYHECIDPAPSLESRVTDVEDAIIELYELVMMEEE